MCGIFGWILPARQRADLPLLQSLTDLLSHRGPDDSGQRLTETADGQHQIGLGHRRLSIIDLGGGAQPMRSRDGTVAVVFNGELYNHVELRDELNARGYSFRTSSDTEVLINAYCAFGPKAVERFRGMFAFALWDASTQVLLLARDPFGKKPPFLAEHAGRLVFGSEVNPLLQFPAMDRSFDHSALADYLLNRYVPGPS
jgi:asparagine synthase (glutamine-hydrolysing)